MQVAEELNHLAQFTNIQALPIYGGQDMERQLRRLRKCPQIIVATPGRLIDHMKRGTIDLSHITTIVLDEADEMLDMGFIDDINLIMPLRRIRARPCSSRLPCPSQSSSWQKRSCTTRSSSA